MDNLIIDNTKTIQDVINKEDRNILILFTSISDEVLNKNIINNVFEIKDIYETFIYNYQKDLEFKHSKLYSSPKSSNLAHTCPFGTIKTCDSLSIV